MEFVRNLSFISSSIGRWREGAPNPRPPPRTLVCRCQGDFGLEDKPSKGEILELGRNDSVHDAGVFVLDPFKGSGKTWPFKILEVKQRRRVRGNTVAYAGRMGRGLRRPALLLTCAPPVFLLLFCSPIVGLRREFLRHADAAQEERRVPQPGRRHRFLGCARDRRHSGALGKHIRIWYLAVIGRLVAWRGRRLGGFRPDSEI